MGSLESRKHDLNDTMQNVELLKKRLARAQEGMTEKREYAEKCQAEYDGAKKLKQLQVPACPTQAAKTQPAHLSSAQLTSATD